MTMTWRSALAAATLCVCAIVPDALSAQEQKRTIGNWQISEEQDRFGDGSTVSATTGTGVFRLAIRCVDRKLTVALTDTRSRGGFLTDESFQIKFRADNRPIVDVAGIAINDGLIRIDQPKDMVQQMFGAKEIAFRITNSRDVWIDLVYNLIQPERALAPVVKACPKN
jgi:hypothetical protein